jgi:tetratricopeptide (TPR) repeat protein
MRRALIVGSLLAAAAWPALPARASEPMASLDERVELDGFFQFSTGIAPSGFVRPSDGFTAAIPPAPSAARRLAPAIPFDARAQVLLRLGPAPELRDSEVPVSIEEQVGTPADVAGWLETLRALAKDPATEKALSAEDQELQPLIDSFRAKLSSAAFIAAIEEYTGLPLQGSHRISLSPFHAAAGVANVIADQDDGTVIVKSLVGRDRAHGQPEFWNARVPGTLWHEEAHGITDPLALAWSARIERASPKDRTAICYGEWRQCVREHVVRAVMLRLIERRLGAGVAAEQLAFEIPARFRWLSPMVERLKNEYERDRARWPTLADFYPRLLDALGPDSDEASAPLRPERETGPARARLVRLAREALPRMKDPAASAHLRRAADLAAEDRGHDPARDGAGSKPDGAALTAQGVEAFQKGRRDEALVLFDAALKRDPDDVEAQLSRAVILDLSARRDDALAGYDRAIATARRLPETFPARVLADALSARARLLLDARRRKEALRDLDEALALAPRDWGGRAEAEALRRR